MVAFVVLVVLVTPFSSGAAAPNPAIGCPGGGNGRKHGDWYSMEVPSFPAGAKEISELAVEHLNPSYLYVTNGSAVLRSADGGCSWRESYRLPASPGAQGFTQQDARIVALRVAGDIVYLGIQQTAPVSRPYVLRSDDRGGSWQSAVGGEMTSAVGVLRDLAAAAMVPEAVYALVDGRVEAEGLVAAHSGPVIFASKNGGADWTRSMSVGQGARVEVAGGSVSVNQLDELSGLEVDPFEPQELWAHGSTGTMRSDDGGVTFSSMPVAAAGVIDMQPLGRGSRVAVFASSAATAAFSTDHGRSFSTVATPGTVDSAGHGSGPDDVMVGTGGRVFLMGPPPRGTSTPVFYDVSPADGPPIRGVTGAAPRMIFGHTDRTVEVNPLMDFEFPPLPLLDLPELQARPDVDISARDVARLGAGRILPRKVELDLDLRERRRVDYKLQLPPAPSPLDVYFLIDVSGSMGGTIAGVSEGMQEIVDRLTGLGIDVHFGVGSYRSFEDPPPYERMREIGPVDGSLEDAFNRLDARGGGMETQLYALQRSVGGVSGEPDAFTFRPGSLRVAIHATDEPFSTGGEHPDYAQVSEALRRESVQQVGLAIQADPGDPLLGTGGGGDLPSDGLIRVATETDAVAPLQGVDCDGDGAADIAAGEALVCQIPPDRSSDAGIMADAVANVLESLEDLADLKVTATPAPDAPAGAGPVVQSVSPRLFPRIDLKERHSLPFSVVYTCPPVAKPTTFPIQIDVSAGSRPIARSEATVSCDPSLLPAKPPPPAKAIPPFAPPPPPQVARIPQPQPNPNPQPQTQPQPQPQSQGQAQASLVPQRQEQPQLAFVHAANGVKDQLAGEHAMVSMRRGRDPFATGRLMLGMAVVSLMAAGVSLTLSRATAPAPVSRRRQPGD